MADIICRWRNGTPKTVMELANSLPHTVMPISEFRKGMSDKWNGEFFRSPYQLACQLALYCEAEDGNYYPRFDHDINEAEAHRYLELWISHYYIPNPYVANDGFKNLKCPTYILKALYDYVQTNPGCDYETAYKECFHDYAKNNDDIVRNYINRFSKILSFSKNGKLSTTNYNANKYFSFMDRNNKKEFFDTFNTQDQPSLMDTYLSKNIDEKKQMFYEYLRSTGLADSSCKQYAFTHPFHEEVIQIIQENANKKSLFDVIDGWMVKKIHKLVCQLEGNKKQGNAWSASISNYKNFLDYLEVGVNDSSGVTTPQTLNDVIIENHTEDPDKMASTPVNFINSAQQIIYYGAPGTGKSHTIDQKVTEDNSIRTTFHPDSDYSTFVGAYKPKMDGEKIVYKFQPQAFLKAYCKAWKNSDKSIYLVIEEINRGNCAQIFGDLFQLLDRCKNGYSSYAIEPDSDITDFLMTDKEYSLKNLILAEDITNDNGKVIASAECVKMGKEFVLPPNMSILCTMNTSDQSLFPMDSAFKRRWQWRYTPIEQPKAGEAGEPRKWKIMADGRWCYWWEFLQAINEVIEEVNHSEDKQLGYYFAKPDDGEYINAKSFVNKVIFYLWNDIFKDEECDIFKYNPIKLTNEDEVKIDGIKEDTELTFRRFVKSSEEVREEVVRWFVDNILKEKNIEMLDDINQIPVTDKVAYMREIPLYKTVSNENDDTNSDEDSNTDNDSAQNHKNMAYDINEISFICEEYKNIALAISDKSNGLQHIFFKNGLDTQISSMPISYARLSLAMDKSKKQAEVKFYNPAPSGYKESKALWDFLPAEDAESKIQDIAQKYKISFRKISDDPEKVTGWALTIPVDYNNIDVEAVAQMLWNVSRDMLDLFKPWIDEFMASHKYTI